ncbi:ribonuclease HII [Ruminococcaceae bacterium OttesenSCG-928-I18]|nr:ribonuclease HII [Ruminococcaceae bacterium OttesenSCG-928-I18]
MEKSAENPFVLFDREKGGAACLLCGVDEAGRGPLCGPVTVAAAILDYRTPIEGLNDSKKISEKKREKLYELIIECALAYEVVHIPPEVIDEINIHNATLLGMKKAVGNLKITPDQVLVDGNFVPALSVPCQAVVKGDAKSACIAAASILAKVTRDRLMRELGKEYPQYRLEQHKGYPTKLHYALLDEHGVAPFYRKSFLKKRGYV